MIAIINYGLGNLGSIANMLKVIGEKSIDLLNNFNNIFQQENVKKITLVKKQK